MILIEMMHKNSETKCEKLIEKVFIFFSNKLLYPAYWSVSRTWAVYYFEIVKWHKVCKSSTQLLQCNTRSVSCLWETGFLFCFQKIWKMISFPVKLVSLNFCHSHMPAYSSQNWFAQKEEEEKCFVWNLVLFCVMSSCSISKIFNLPMFQICQKGIHYYAMFPFAASVRHNLQW